MHRFPWAVSVTVGLLLVGLAGAVDVESLPGPVVNPHSFELLSNSRYSIHSGFEDTLPTQVLANVLWAMNRTPRLGDYRELYVATGHNVYLYDPGNNTIAVHKPGDHRYASGSAFEVGVAAARHEEVGFAIQAGLLAGFAFVDSAGMGVASCPMKWAANHANREWDPDHDIEMVNVYGLAETRDLDTTLAAISSDSTLPEPHTTSSDSFELVLMDLGQDSTFEPFGPSLETVSQLLWAAYGVTPHYAYNGSHGLAVPSAIAGYFLTGMIYLVRDCGIDRFHNREPGGSLNTADHRLEEIVSGDRRPDLRLAAAHVPSTAPTYVVICVSDTGSYMHVQEAGFAAFQLLAQARAVGLSGFLTMPLTRDERTDIAIALNLPSGQHPVLVFSVGEPATGISEQEQPALVEIVRAQPVIRNGNGLRVEYLLRQPGIVRAEVYDMLGRPVCRISEARQSAGYHTVEWDGLGQDGRRVKQGSYVLGIFAPGSVAQHKVTVF